MPHTRIKICGITRPEDAINAMESGADFLGFNFVGGPRQISFDTGIYIRDLVVQGRGLDPNIVALCHISSPGGSFASKGGSPANWRDVLGLFAQTLQIYGQEFESLNSLEGLKVVWWMVHQVRNRRNFLNATVEIARLKLKPAAILFDTASPDKLGGTGQSFNWNWIAEARAAGELAGLPPIILAGGLTPDNVADAIRIAQPYAVDVSSGVEVVGKPGIKDPIKMRDFIQAVRATG